MAKDNEQERIKSEILTALSHPEAEEGLYFRNFFHLHEEDERPPVRGKQEDILAALHQMVSDGIITTQPGFGEENEMIFSLPTGISAH